MVDAATNVPIRPRRPVLEAISVVVGVLAAAATAASLVHGAAAISVNSWSGGGFLWVMTFIVALAHALVLGLPIFLLLRWLRRLPWWASLVGGFLVGSMPYAIVSFPSVQGTADAWRVYAETVAFLGGLGMAGGFAAWLVWYWIGRDFARPIGRGG